MFRFKISMSNINFRASYIDSTNILKRYENSYKPFEAQLVEFNPDDKNDLFTIKEVSDLWGEGYAVDINENFKIKNFKKNKRHVYGLTSQKGNYNYIQPDNVLGLVEFIENKDSNKISFLQVSPENQAYQFGRPDYKKIGTRIIDLLKKMYSSKPMKLHSAFSAKFFYLKNGFKKDMSSNDKLDYVWNEL